MTLRHTLLAGLICACLGLPRLAGQESVETTKRSADDLIGPIHVPGDSLDQILALLERWTGRALLRPQSLPNLTLTLNLRQQVTREEAIQAVESLLNLNGIAVTPLGSRFLKVTPLAAAKSEAPEFIEGSLLTLTPSGRIVSKLFQLEFLRVGEFMPQIAGLLNPAASSPPVVFEKSNAALLTDSVSNLQRVELLLTRLDRPSLAGMQPKFYTLQSAKAGDVVAQMRAILSGPIQTQLGTATAYQPDDRTNQIVLITDPRQHPFFDELIARLDVQAERNTRNEVVYLKHASAKEVASILSQLVSGQNSAARTNTATLPAAPKPADDPAAKLTGARPALEPSHQFSPVLTVLPEERSNSIVVSGTLDDIRLINDLVARIDILLAQVRIEVVIAEVTLSDNASSGISTLGLQIQADKLVGFAGTGPGISVTDALLSRDPAGGSHDLAAAIGLTTTPRKSNVAILSQPNITTTHNRQGSIFVGESRPVISSYLPDGAGIGSGFGTGYRSTVASKDIGIGLSVTPLIGNDGAVQLEIEQEVNDVLGEITIDGNPQPRIGRRTTKSFVSARSGEIIVLGGLQRSSRGRNTNRLGPVPLLGDLLGARSREETRTDLVFFLRPVILTNSAADNSAALRQIGELPSGDRERIQKALQPAG
ncbi:MAG: type II secretory pathway, component PulD [Opitutaceae bacterium]|nr:type II secretory pathway, component PulD [Opitutaceae bacterium]